MSLITPQNDQRKKKQWFGKAIGMNKSSHRPTPNLLRAQAAVLACDLSSLGTPSFEVRHADRRQYDAVSLSIRCQRLSDKKRGGSGRRTRILAYVEKTFRRTYIEKCIRIGSQAYFIGLRENMVAFDGPLEAVSMWVC